MNTLSFAFRALRREWRAGDLRLVVIAVVIAIGCLTSVTAFSDRLHKALERQGNELLGADLVVRSSFPPDPTWAVEAGRRGLATTRTDSFRSVVAVGKRAQLAEVKAVDPGYPLRGRLRTATRPGAVDAVTDEVPPPGSVWIDHQLLALLELEVGDSVRVGNSELAVARIVTVEPDRGASAFVIAPRLLMNRSDLDATGLIGPGSIVSYRLLVSGEDDEVRRFRHWLEPLLGTGVRLQDVSDARPRMRLALDRAERFLSLCTLVSVLLAGVSIAWGARQYAERSLDAAAIMRCLGASQRDVVVLHAAQLLGAGAGGGILGAALGYAGQQLLVMLLPAVFGGVLPWPGPAPALTGMAIGLVLLIGFGLPPIMRLRRVPPLRVLRRDLGHIPVRTLSLYLGAGSVLAGLIMWAARDWLLTLYVLGGAFATIVALAGIAYGVIRAMARLPLRAGSVWRFALANLARRIATSSGQAVAIGLGIMAMLLLTVVRGDLFRSWENRLPPDTPNHFLINVLPEQRAEVEAFLTERGLHPEMFSPLVRARLLEINGDTVRPSEFSDPFARRSLERAANLSWRLALQDDNRLAAGRWWSAQDVGSKLLSVEREYAAALGIGIGDRLTYQVGSDRIALEVVNLREVSWDSFRPNFFLLVPPGVMEQFPATLMTSVFVPPGDHRFLGDVSGRFPNLTDIDVGAILTQVRRLMDRLNTALEFVFLFTIAAGIVVLASAIRASQAERRREIAVLRTVGVRRRRLSQALLAEYAVLGAVAGVIGAIGASAVGVIVAETLLGLDYRLNVAMGAAGFAVGSVLVAVTGFWGTRRLVGTPPWETLRRT